MRKVSLIILGALMLAACQGPDDAKQAAPSATPSAKASGPSSLSQKDTRPELQASPPPVKASACLMQDGKLLAVKPLRAVGTEPFWGVRIEGRCVTYSHPEDQKGTRVWTRFTAKADGGVWSGSLGGRKFELKTSAAPGCSDGMSDTRYPIAVDLTVNGEQRKGCAATT